MKKALKRAIEVKMRKKYGVVKVRKHDNGGFILPNGEIVNTTHHDGLCKSIGCTLSDAIQSGLCRFASRTGREGKVIAFEYAELTTQQKVAIKIMLRMQDYFTVVTVHDVISRFRPVRTIKFEA